MIRKRGRKGFCSAEFMIDGHTYQFTFNGKKGMPLITSKTEAREYENPHSEKPLGTSLANSLQAGKHPSHEDSSKDQNNALSDYLKYRKRTFVTTDGYKHTSN